MGDGYSAQTTQDRAERRRLEPSRGLDWRRRRRRTSGGANGREKGPRQRRRQSKRTRRISLPPVQWSLTGGECLSQVERTERWVCCRDICWDLLGERRGEDLETVWDEEKEVEADGNWDLRFEVFSLCQMHGCFLQRRVACMFLFSFSFFFVLQPQGFVQQTTMYLGTYFRCSAVQCSAVPV